MKEGEAAKANGGRRRRRRSRLGLWIEYVFAWIAVGIISHIPPRAACALASALGSLTFYLYPRRRRIAIENVLASGIATTRREASRIARGSFRSFALTIVESFFFGHLEENLECDIPKETIRAIEESKCGFICYSGHLGNWEVGAQFLARFRPVTGIARPMNNARVQKLIERKQMRAGFETIDKHSGRPMDIVRALKRNRALAVLSDQHASGDSAVLIDFFGRKAATYTTPVVMQQLTGAPIVFGYAARIGFMRFRVHISEPIFYTIPKEGKAEAIAAATQDLSNRLEAAIHEYPEQYLWAHRRWKSKTKQ